MPSKQKINGNDFIESHLKKSKSNSKLEASAISIILIKSEFGILVFSFNLPIKTVTRMNAWGEIKGKSDAMWH